MLGRVTVETLPAFTAIAFGEHLSGRGNIREAAARLVCLVDGAHFAALAVGSDCVRVVLDRHFLHLGVLADHPCHVVVAASEGVSQQ